MIQSFDIFDTCFTRSCGNPKAVFRLLAKAIAMHDDESIISDIIRARIDGEIKARKTHKSSEDICINHIYENCDFHYLTKKTNEEILQKELEIEHSVLVPVYCILNKINKIHKGGDSVLYVSDMYLPSSFLKDLLVEYGFWADVDELYVSCETKCTKSSGNLFRYIKGKKNLDGIWIHRGDNLHSDFLQPLKQFICPILVNHNYSNIQKRCNRRFYSAVSPDVNLFTSISRAVLYKYGEHPTNKFAADLISPLLVSYVGKIFNDARRRGINKLYFLARDGYVLYRIAEVFCPYFEEISIEYIYASRKSLYLPSIIEYNIENIKKYLGDDINNVKKVAYKLNIEKNVNLVEYKNGNELVDAIFSNSVLCQIARSAYLTQKNNAIGYFKQVGLAHKESKNAIVDLRGTRKCEQAINSILNEFNYPSVMAYYMEVEEGRVKRNSPNDIFFSSIYRENSLLSGEYKVLHEACFLLEQYFCLTNQQRTTGYAFDGASYYPIFEEDCKLDFKSEEIADININISRDFAEHYAKCYLLPESDILFNIAYSTFIDFIKIPQQEYLQAVDGVSASENPFETKFILTKLSPSNIIHRNVIWLDASVLYSFGKFGFLLFKIIKPIFKCLHILH